MKRLVNMYYNSLMFLEDVICAVSKAVNDHRRRVDDKYWDKYLKPEVTVRAEPNSKTCPFCHSIDIMIYDQEYDCCLTCNKKWEVKG